MISMQSMRLFISGSPEHNKNAAVLTTVKTGLGTPSMPLDLRADQS
jgi:hypothetical protein